MEYMQINKLVSFNNTFRFKLIDSGATIACKFEGDGRAFVETDSTTTGSISVVKLIMDAFVTPKPESWDKDRHFAMVKSYARCASSLMAAEVMINNTPFPTILSTCIGMQLGTPSKPEPTDEIEVYGPELVIHSIQRNTDGKLDWVRPVLPDTIADHPQATLGQNSGSMSSMSGNPPFGVFLPKSSNFSVELNFPGLPKVDSHTPIEQGSFIWDGYIQLVQTNMTALGALPKI